MAGALDGLRVIDMTSVVMGPTATGFFEEYDHPTEGKLLMARGPKNWSKTPPTVRQHAPRLGENTVEILTEIGYSEEEARKIAGGEDS
jgi:crotonobetainyl-CoA:carnitine CoA-transferase CaiB-like acyl-CoA transferase